MKIKRTSKILISQLLSELRKFWFVNINTGIKFAFKQNHKKLQHFKVLVKTMIITFYHRFY